MFLLYVKCTFLNYEPDQFLTKKWKMGCDRELPDTCIKNIIYTPYCSVGLTTNTQIYIIKRIIQGMLNIFLHFCMKKSTFFSGRRTVTPLIGSFAISLFFDALIIFPFSGNTNCPILRTGHNNAFIIVSGSYQLRSGSYT